jgi:hypothetical protein
MSIAFRKKDYQYDGDDLEYDHMADEGEEEENSRQEFHHKASAVPSDWVMSLHQELKSIAEFHAVEIFDKSDPMIFAEFIASHIEDEAEAAGVFA